MNEARIPSDEWKRLILAYTAHLDGLKKKVASELEPFVEDIRRLDKASLRFRIFKKAFLYYEDKLDRSGKIFTSLLPEEQDDLGTLSATKNTLFLYLGAIESIGNASVDILVMLLIAGGRDFHIECRFTTPRIIHVSSIKELEKERVSLGTKVNFLRGSGMKVIPSIIDSKLRNAIAHLDIEIVENEVYLKLEEKKEPAFPKALHSLLELTNTVSQVRSSLDDLGQDLGLIFTRKS